MPDWDIIRRDIKTVGMNTFVKYYGEYQKLSTSELIQLFSEKERWVLSSRSSKASTGKSIFNKNNQKETLELIISSNAREQTISKAIEIYYQEYPNSTIEKIRFVRPEFVFGENIIKKLFNGYEIKEQFRVNKYIVDWYIPELNLAIELDEEHHRRQTDEDQIRQNMIETELECNFLRFKV